MIEMIFCIFMSLNIVLITMIKICKLLEIKTIFLSCQSIFFIFSLTQPFQHKSNSSNNSNPISVVRYPCEGVRLSCHVIKHLHKSMYVDTRRESPNLLYIQDLIQMTLVQPALLQMSKVHLNLPI